MQPQALGVPLTARHMRGVLLALGLLTTTLVAAAGPEALPAADQQAFWTSAEKLIGFRSMARLYGGDVVHHGTGVMPLPKALRELGCISQSPAVPSTSRASWSTTVSPA